MCIRETLQDIARKNSIESLKQQVEMAKLMLEYAETKLKTAELNHQIREIERATVRDDINEPFILRSATELTPDMQQYTIISFTD